MNINHILLNKEIKVHVLLTTYNGEKYIIEQLNSIFNQSHRNWELIIRDDGSSDNTINIIKSYAFSDSRIILLNDSYGNLRSCQSFSVLMEKVKNVANYVMFCDQDDIWLKNKIELSLYRIIESEQKFGAHTSQLIYSNYKLINQQGSLLSHKPPAFPSNPQINLLLAKNYIYGCTSIINKHLLFEATPISEYAENHDYWVAIVALASNGFINYIDMPLLLYRQHQNNVSGSYKNAFLINRFNRLRNKTYNIIMLKRIKMFKDVLLKFNDKLSENNKIILEEYIKNATIGGFKAVAFCISMDIRMLSFFQTIAFYVGILSGVKKDI